MDSQFPVFALSFCIVRKTDYFRLVVPAVQELKFKYWGHDAVILHEHEIRKSKGAFSFLLADRQTRESFYADLHQIMVDAPISIIGAVIDKRALLKRYARPWSPYELALHFCLERLDMFLRRNGQDGRRVHIVFECRGKTEDSELELTFRRIIAGSNRWGYRNHDFSTMELEPVFARKSVNSTGLQLADLTARPLALQVLIPEQRNRTFDVLREKLAYRKTFP
nr:DUF3800 domain-containing protein [Vannielia litorea]